jgi:hypothetical protein
MIVLLAAVVLLVSMTLIAAFIARCVKNRNARPAWTRTYSRAEVQQWKTLSRP